MHNNVRGNKEEPKCSERYYVPSEMTWLLNTLGFTKIDIFGAKLGAFSRNDNLTTEDFEMLVVADEWGRTQFQEQKQGTLLVMKLKTVLVDYIS